jgi:hypothetical protein
MQMRNAELQHNIRLSRLLCWLSDHHVLLLLLLLLPPPQS